MKLCFYGLLAIAAFVFRFLARAQVPTHNAYIWFQLTTMIILALASSASAAAQTPRFNFTYTGSLATFTAPIAGTYQILAFGAQGGTGCSVDRGPGGRGAEIGGDFVLTVGETLQIAVGGAGTSGCGGGGGQFRGRP